jgi:type IV pilus assembly protein PilB
VEAGLINKKDLDRALELQKVHKRKIGQLLIEIGAATDEEISKALADQLEIPLIHLDQMEIPQNVVNLVPPELAQTHLVFPIKAKGNSLLVAMTNPLDLFAVEDLRFATKMRLEIAVASQRDILDAIERYHALGELEMDVNSLGSIEEGVEIIKQEEAEEKDIEDLKSLSELPPVVRLINSIIADAIKIEASDIHIEPQKYAVIIRFRVDGIMREVLKTNRHIHSSLVSRIKVVSNMDISIRRKPQDGRCQVLYRNKNYDLRVSTIPVTYGEKVTMRILDQARAGIRLEDLGMSENNFRKFSEAIKKPQGLILVTGPTGSGKSSTLYACLNRLNSPSVNIITVEDPVEFDIAGINQVQINPQAGITFAAGLRSILRQDPDIVMVGEIRDGETASIAFQAGQTGHLVLSTLHTNDASSAVTRLMDLGIPSFLVSASLISVVGQRLVRKICRRCKGPDPLTPQVLKELSAHMEIDEKMTFWKGAGCEACQYTGYSGRLGIFEILTLTPSLKEMIQSGVSAVALKKAAARDGYRSMTLEGIKKALEGLTTIEEVYRVAPPDDEEIFRDQVESPEQVMIDASLIRPSAASFSSVKPKKILVADDNEVNLRMFRNLLESEDYLVVTTKNGLDAFKVTMQEKPDLIISNFTLPKINGLDLIKKLKSQVTTRYVPIILLIGKGEGNFEMAGNNSGADACIRKPVSSKNLLVRVNRLLDKAAGSD